MLPIELDAKMKMDENVQRNAQKPSCKCISTKERADLATLPYAAQPRNSEITDSLGPN